MQYRKLLALLLFSTCVGTKVLYMSFDRFLLAFESRDLSQADKSIRRVSSFPSWVMISKTSFLSLNNGGINFLQNECSQSFQIYLSPEKLRKLRKRIKLNKHQLCKIAKCHICFFLYNCNWFHSIKLGKKTLL